MHEGVCSTHIGGRALATKVSKVGYYLPTLKGDYMVFVKNATMSKIRQLTQSIAKEPTYGIKPLVIPYVESGYLGSFPSYLGQVKFFIVVVDYFTKWVKVEPVTSISIGRVKKFYWRKIICKFGILVAIVSDNGT